MLYSLTYTDKNKMKPYPFVIGNVDVSPGTTIHINCLKFDNSTLICLERDSINNLYSASNIRGLCFGGE